MANLINFGIVPLTLSSEEDYERISEGDAIVIKNFSSAIKDGEEVVLENTKNGARVALKLGFSPRQREILLAGGMLNYTRNQK
jgi:aconitate hydratase